MNRIKRLLGSRHLFWIIPAFFVFEAIWIALSAVYPQAFDENFHFGLIQVYSHYWLPFLSSQPAHANAYGAVARDPSYLYHYLMSFPYRLIAVFFHGQAAQVILLRFINVGLFTAGLILFRRVLLRLGISHPLTNTILLLFVLIPIVPQLAAQINYDNLLFPLVAWICLLTFQFVDEIKKHHPSIRTLLTLGIVCVLASLVKYAFLPIFAGVVLFLLWMVYRNYWGKLRKLGSLLTGSWTKQSAKVKAILIIMSILSVGLFIQRDGVNYIDYHSFNPSCSSVLSVTDCKAYSPWDYNYNQHKLVKAEASTIKFTNPLAYLGEWLYWIWYRLFFAVNGPSSGFTNYPPLPLPSAAGGLVAIVGIVAIIKWRKRIFHGNPYFAFLLIICSIYLISLIVTGYSSYRYTDVLENMNGRYLIPILILMVAIAGRAFSLALRKSPGPKALLAGLAVVLFLQGGGILTFISRSDDSWDWPSTIVTKANHIARKITNPVIVNGKKTYKSSIWYFN